MLSVIGITNKLNLLNLNILPKPIAIKKNNLNLKLSLNLYNNKTMLSTTKSTVEQNKEST